MRSAVVERVAPGGRHEQMRRLGEKPAPDVRLEAREERERDDERRDAERQAEERRERDDPHLRVPPRGEEVPAGEERARSRLRPHQREEDDVADRREFVKSIARRSMPTPSPAVGGIPYDERLDVVLVVEHRLVVALRPLGHLGAELLGLLVGVVQLAEAVRDLHPPDEELEAVGGRRVVRLRLRERRDLRRVVDDERRLEEPSLRHGPEDLGEELPLGLAEPLDMLRHQRHRRFFLEGEDRRGPPS